MSPPLPMERPLVLASGSPRRRSMLLAAGLDVDVRVPPVDDGTLRPGEVTAAQWVMALAYLKARSVVDGMAARGAAVGTVLAADTLCTLGDRLLGQPADVDEARSMLLAMRGRAHDVITGVCVVVVGSPLRWMFADRATVRWGMIDDEIIEAYLRTDGWRGKAGAYNLEDRCSAGWPIECDGDPATVMGLPLQRLEPWIEARRREMMS